MAERKEKTTTSKSSVIEGKMLPNNFEAEQAVLGCALIDSEAALTIISKLEEIDFYNETHRNIFAVIKKLFQNSVTIDFVTVSDELEKQNLINSVGGMAYITSLSNIVPSAASANHYIDIVRRDSVLRQVILACGKTIEKAYDKNSD